MDPMLILIGTVLTASLVGSLHCAGMCGGLMLFALGTDTQSKTKHAKIKFQSAYHGGRLITYTILGIAAGTLGQALNFGGSFIGIQRAATIFAGLFMICFGLIALARIKGLKIKHARAPKPMQNAVEKGQRLAFALTPFKRALTIGLLTTLLPCGWLYAFAFTAAGTGSPLWGGLTMSVFWLGTLPIMASLGAGIQLLAGPLQSKVPTISALAVIFVGVFTATGRLQAPEMSKANLNITDDSIPTNPDDACPLCDSDQPSDQPKENKPDPSTDPKP